MKFGQIYNLILWGMAPNKLQANKKLLIITHLGIKWISCANKNPVKGLTKRELP